MQRLSPIFARAGDLMQRESLMSNEEHRRQTQVLANQIGQALEDVSRASGSVAHFYKTLEISADGRGSHVDFEANHASFKPIIDECEVIRQIPVSGAPA